MTLELFWPRICFLRDFLKEARDRQFLVVLLIEFQIIGPWILIVFSKLGISRIDMKVKGLPSVIAMDVRLNSERNYYLATRVGVSYGGSGTYGQQVDKYKCHGFLICLGRETMGSNVLTTANKYRF